MDWRTTIELLGAIAIGVLAFLPWSIISDGLRELWLTWNGKSQKRSSADK
jgi:hypothetical protein